MKSSAYKKKDKVKVAYLTFDDGPSKNTDQILKILKQHQIKGTFFVLANKSPFGIRMYRKMLKAGHSIGNHTYSHDYSKIYRSKKDFLADFYRMERFLQRIIGNKPRLFRFPGGSNTRLGYSIGGQKTMLSIKTALRSRKYRYFDWTIDSQDTSSPSTASGQIIRNILRESRLKRKCIILFHDFSDASLAALPAVIRGLKRQGFCFDVLSKSSYNYQIAEGQ
ncbi:Peptidoglycan/xylan/chitin deacetylase, PgdA/CDA1 family [Paenibacillus algorifonticola]|uniref:Peptidoglycan/xylan/chitin deacetylase, PgdA/CDA1 family n=1 Tax=Paenibacillus algorifonticola TaxID=684063 RepID=A0A1I1ZT24_9BACL|nr:polysaccharide deacetylase family protein [Paenibacillus algorifonticola]SFE33610.1 Peptidoglycan/xylan/chitin deacetylase, PgdA/CDA1 family [Paenibacillus algorifonticola]